VCAAGKACPTPATAGIRSVAQAFDGSGTGIDIPVPDGSANMFNFGVNDSFTIEYWMQRDTVCPASGRRQRTTRSAIGRDVIGNGLHWWVGVTCNPERRRPRTVSSST
jgi:hypothetical protein